MKNVFIVLLFLVASSEYSKANVIHKTLEIEWENFKLNHDKKYDSPIEEAIRKAIFSDRLFKIKEHNKLYAKGAKTYKMGVNKFSDLTLEEMEKHKGLKRNTKTVKQIKHVSFTPKVNAHVPDALDWREAGAVTPVKDQGECGSCWAFSAVGALEGQYFRKTGKLISLSEQNLVDCSNQGLNEGCAGGEPSDAFDYVYLNDGIDKETEYPYKDENGVCRYKEEKNITSVRYFGLVQIGNEDYLKSAVATIGPISVDIYSDDSFQNYESGVYYNGCCETDSLNHAVVVVGYGTTDDDVDYWLVKNSWGEDWGEKGYIRMARNNENNCGIASFASFPIMY